MTDAAWGVINTLRDGWCSHPCAVRAGCGCADAIDASLRSQRDALVEALEEFFDAYDRGDSAAAIASALKKTRAALAKAKAQEVTT